MSNKATLQPAYNSDINTWNVPVNSNTQNLDDALGTTQTFALTGVSGTVAVTATTFAGAYPANTASYIPAIFYCSGVPTGAVSLQIPASVGGTWIINNQCTGVFSTVTISSAGAGTSVNIPSATIATAYSDGTNILSTNTTLGSVTSLNDNRIINGDMRIDQRNSGASGTSSGYTIDRWIYSGTQSNKFAWERIGPNATPEAIGFPYYFNLTSLSSFSPASSDVFIFYQPIEADMISDFAWGTAGAQPVTLSFWVSCTLTGTFSGSIRNAAANRAYPFSYSIPSPGLLTNISVTIPGDISGTWVLGGNGASVYVFFDLGSGSTFRGTAGAWASADYVGVTGAVDVVSTNGAQFAITGVKLEVGSIATPFNRQSLTTSLADCQRYYQVAAGILYAYNNNLSNFGGAVTLINLPVLMRTPPTISVLSSSSTPSWVAPSSFVSSGFSNQSVLIWSPNSQPVQAWNEFFALLSAEL